MPTSRGACAGIAVAMIPGMHLSVVQWPGRGAFARARSQGRVTPTSLAAVAGGAALAVVIGAACAVSGAASPSGLGPSVDPAVAPSDVLFYPHVLYGGDDAYLVDGKWYRPGVSGWVVFTREPLELELLRQTLEPPRPSSWFANAWQSWQGAIER